MNFVSFNRQIYFFNAILCYHTGMKVKTLCMIISSTLILSACGEESNNSQSEAPVVIVPPVEEAYDSSQDTNVEGRDEDNNGIRDDIDEYLSNNFKNSTDDLKLSMTSVAKSLQTAIVEGTSSLNSEDARESLLLSINCMENALTDVIDPLSGYRTLRAETLNTKLRLDAYSDYQKLISMKVRGEFDATKIDQFCSSL